MTRRPPYPVQDPNPSFTMTVASFKKKDCFFTALSTVASFAVWGIPRTASLRVTCGAASFIGAFTYGYIKTYNRLRGFVHPDD